MKAIVLMTALVAANFTPLPKVQKIGCVAYQVCNTCTNSNGQQFKCACHMECLPGIN